MQGIIALEVLDRHLGLELRGMITMGLAHGISALFRVTVRADDRLSYCPGIWVHFRLPREAYEDREVFCRISCATEAVLSFSSR